jgi:enoyl-CoA hydratase/carnithine racemase
MTQIKTESRGSVAIVRLQNGVTNALGPELLDDLSREITRAKHHFRGVVLAGGTKFFCIGFDLPRLLTFDRTAMTQFLADFNQVVLDLLTLPLPTACAIGGHAIAGGNILALACDYRFAGSGKKLMGLNEVRLGVPVPYLADLILRQLVGDRLATDLLFHGELVDLSEAERIGLVDGVVPPEELEAHAVQKIAQLSGLPRTAFAAIKANRLEDLRSRFERHHREKDETFLDCWFSEPVRLLLADAAKKF